jgi:metallo-beta-lactamase family protein
MQIEFHGAAGEVTGSCFLVTCGHHRVLLECGMFQGSSQVEARNREPFPFDAASLDAVILSHAHLDHSGRLPILVKTGYSAGIYTHRATRDLCGIMLRDAGYLAEREAEWENRKRERKGLRRVEALFTMEDAAGVMEHFRPVEYGEMVDVAPGIRFRLLDAGHIIGSAIVELWLSEGSLERKIVFSGDLGHRGAPILRDPQPVESADLVLLESTYGDRLHRPWEATWSELAEILRDAEHRKGNVLIPSFAVGRSQELLYVFGQNFEAWGLDRWRVFLDSPMAIEATEVYARHWRSYDAEARAAKEDVGNPLALPNLTMTRTSEESMGINRIRSGAIVIAGSGMCEGGRIKHHLKHNVWRKESHVIIVGFQARGTLGRRLVDGARFIRLWGETLRVAASIHTVGGLSAHADQRGLVEWVSRISGAPPVVLVHGEDEARETLAARLRADRPGRVELAAPGGQLDLSRLG